MDEMKIDGIGEPKPDLRTVLVRGLQEMNAALRERIEVCEELLRAYGVDENEAFPSEVDRYFNKFNVKHKREERL